MLAAAQLGDGVGLVNLIGALAPQLRRNFRNYRLDGVVGPIVRMEAGFSDVMAAYADPARLVDAFTVAARRAIGSGANVIGPGEVPLNVFLADQGVQTRVDDVPVLDSLGDLCCAGSPSATSSRRRCTSVSSGPSRSPGPVTSLRAIWRRPSRWPSRFAIRPGSGDATRQVTAVPGHGWSSSCNMRQRIPQDLNHAFLLGDRYPWEDRQGKDLILPVARLWGRNRRQAPGARMVVAG